MARDGDCKTDGGCAVSGGEEVVQQRVESGRETRAIAAAPNATSSRRCQSFRMLTGSIRVNCNYWRIEILMRVLNTKREYSSARTASSRSLGVSFL